MREREQCRRVALGLDRPTLLIEGGRVFSPFTGEMFEADVAVCGSLIAGVGQYPGEAERVIDARGAFVIPGFIDAHVHPETSLLSPPRFAEALVVHGITTTLSEPHEITNVMGRAGIDFYLAARPGLPLDLRIMIPTTVPASPFEHAAGRLETADVADLLEQDGVTGMGEAMDYMGLISGEASGRLFDLSGHRVVDGHAPGVSGRQLAAYMVAGPSTDHETSDPELILERRRLGMWTLIREGSAARDLARALPFLVEHGTERTALCTDDRNAAALAEHHHLDGVVAALCRAGVGVAAALRTATANPAALYRLFDRGALTPGFRADILVVEDPAFPHPREVVQAGRVVARAGQLIAPLPATPALASPPFRLEISDPSALAPAAADGLHRARAIHLLPRAIVSEERFVEVRARGGHLLADPEKDICLAALLERRPGASGPAAGSAVNESAGAAPAAGGGPPVTAAAGQNKVGCGLVSGLGLRSGAIATTIAHDAHHLLVVGADPVDMLAAARAVAAAGGGLAVVKGDTAQVLALPLAGLMADLPVATVGARLRSLEGAAGALGVDFEEPFMVLSFITLSVIPRLRLTLDGLLDVEAQALVPAIVD
jgi:adenine deaminase